MKIRSKLAVFIMIYILIWIAAMGSIFNSIAMRGYDTLEEESFQANIDRLDSAIHDVMRNTDKVLIDWAEWDDTYSYIHSPKDAYIRSNISTSVMEEQSLDYIFIYGPNDEILEGFHYKDGTLIRSKPDRIVDTLIKHKNRTGVMLHDGRPLIFSTKQITNTYETAPKRGLLCFAYYLESDHVKEIERDLELDIKLVSVSEKYYGEEERMQVFDHGTYKTALYKYQYVNDPHSFALQFRHPLSITALGQETMKEVMFASVIAFIIISIVLYEFIKRFVDRVKNLGTEVDRIAHDRDFSLRLDVQSKDEISLLTTDINLMLDRIESMNDQLMEYASIDMMTGVFNRRVGFEILEKMLLRYGEEYEDLTICYIDINNLKVVNDSMGHSCGDDLIRTVSGTVKEFLKEEEVICRLGGDEFLVIFPHVDEQGARKRMRSIEKQLAFYQLKEEMASPISISKGFFLSYDGESSIQTFVEAADHFMYEDKKMKKRKAFF